MIFARSSAVVPWLEILLSPSSSGTVFCASRPFGVRNRVFSQPISSAFRFIIPAKPSMLPPTCSAIAIAESLWDSSIMEYSKSSSRKCSPSFIWSLTFGIPAARFDTSTVSDRLPYSSARMQVIILVVLAFARNCSPFFSYKTLPVSPSISTAAVAYKGSDGSASVVAVTASCVSKSGCASSACTVRAGIVPIKRLHKSSTPITFLK